MCFLVVGMSIYGICLAFCVENAFRRMINGETAPQRGNNSANNRSIDFNARPNPYVLRNNGNGTGTRDEENRGGNAGGFKAFKGKGQRIG